MGEVLNLHGCSLHLSQQTYNEYQVSALHVSRVSGVGPSLPMHVRHPSDVYIYASSSVHNFKHVQNCARSSTHQANGHKSKTLVQRAQQMSNE